MRLLILIYLSFGSMLSILRIPILFASPGSAGGHDGPHDDYYNRWHDYGRSDTRLEVALPVGTAALGAASCSMYRCY